MPVSHWLQVVAVMFQFFFFLQNQLPLLLKNIPLVTWFCMYDQGPHFSWQVNSSMRHLTPITGLVKAGHLLNHQDLLILVTLICIFGISWYMMRRHTSEMYCFTEYCKLHCTKQSHCPWQNSSLPQCATQYITVYGMHSDHVRYWISHEYNSTTLRLT